MDDTEKLAQMMIRCGLATGHGDTIDDLIFELEKQIKNTSNAFSDAQKEIERKYRIAIGLISTMPEFENQHPTEVMAHFDAIAAAEKAEREWQEQEFLRVVTETGAKAPE